MSAAAPDPFDPRRSFQGLILTLQRFWAAQGCVILQPYDMEMGAGTFHPATTLRSLGPKPWRAAYVQACRPSQGRALWRKPEPASALLPVSGHPQTVAARSPRSLSEVACRPLASIPPCMTSASSRTIGKARRWAPGGSVGNAGATGWKSRNSPISSRSRESNARRSRAN